MVLSGRELGAQHSNKSAQDLWWFNRAVYTINILHSGAQPSGDDGNLSSCLALTNSKMELQLQRHLAMEKHQHQEPEASSWVLERTDCSLGWRVTASCFGCKFQLHVMQQDPVTVGSRLRTDIRGCSSVFSWHLTQCFMYQNSSTAPGAWRRQLGVKTCIAPLMPIYLWYIFLVHTLFMTGTLWYQHGNMEEHFYSVHTTDRYKTGQLCFRMRFAVRKIAQKV